MKFIDSRPIFIATIFAIISKSVLAADINLLDAPGYNSFQYPGSSVTTVTGIRDSNITGNFSTTGGNTGGLLFQNLLSNFTYIPYPTATSNLSNFPGAVSSTPYGPSFGSVSGILRVVGSYKTATSGSGATGDLGYLVDAASGITTTLLPTTLAGGEPILNTIAHSNFGNQVVGNFDTALIAGKSFVYNISSGAYSSVPLVGSSGPGPNTSISGVSSNTAYGVYNNLISGGYTGTYNGTLGTYSYIHNTSNGATYTFSSPDPSLVTHFEGITSAGKPGIYNLVADAVDVSKNPVKAYVATVDLNVIDPLTGQPKVTWTEIKVGSSLTSANSMYQGNVIGVYTTFAPSLLTQAYQADIGATNLALTSTPIYDPLRNSANITSTFSAGGADVINTGSISVTNGNGIESGASCGYLGCNPVTDIKYGGVISNYGAVSVTGGSGNRAIAIDGDFGTLLNYGSIQASNGNFAISDFGTSAGTTVVNTSSGVIDGRVVLTQGESARFENSGWMGISAAGAGVTHLVSGSFVQTSTGTLGLRVSSSAADKFNINGVGRLGGTLSITGDSANIYPAARYALLTADSGLSGTFKSFNSNLASATNLSYDANNVYLNVYAFTTAETQQSLVNNVSALQSTYTLQNSVLANSFTYDCTEFGPNGICISAGGRNTAVSAANGLNNTSALLIAAYKVHPQVRIGAYADQNLSVNNAGSTVNLANNTPLIGLFGAWNERLDGTGTEVKVSAAYGQKNATVTRSVVGTSEAGTGGSQLNSQGAQVTAKYGFGIMDKVIASPYVGIRYAQNNMGGYTEATSASVTAPLTYSALNTNATTALAGVGASYKLTPAVTTFASAGVESDTSTSNGTYSATGIYGLTPINFNANPVKTRPTATLGAYYDVAKNQRLGITGIYRQEAYQAYSTTTVMATYTIGL